jgi:YgiT-type zinc finger domain-containing protein
MSSSPQSVRPTNKARRQQAVRFASLPCPVCGRRTLADVVEDCELSGGRLIKQLRHTRCRSCGERFFDVAAISAIEAARKPLPRRRLA